MQYVIFYDIMAREYKTVRISSQALSKLQQYSKDNGITIIRAIDSLLGIHTIKDMFRPNVSAEHKRVYEFAVQQQKESGLSESEWVENALKGYQQATIDIIFDEFKELISEKFEQHGKKASATNKPPNAVLESAILYAFKEYKKTSLPRQKIKEYVISQMLDTKPHDKSWSEVFPEWWKDYNRNASSFEYEFDNRLKRLRSSGLVEKDPNDSVYTHKLTKKHWDKVIAMNSIYPADAKIDRLFPRGL